MPEAKLPKAEKIEKIPVNQLIPYMRNPRKHSEKQISQIQVSKIRGQTPCHIHLPVKMSRSLHVKVISPTGM